MHRDCLLAPCFANSANVKALRDRPLSPVVLPRIDCGAMHCRPWTAIRHRVGHPRALRAPSWSPVGRSSRPSKHYERHDFAHSDHDQAERIADRSKRL